LETGETYYSEPLEFTSIESNSLIVAPVPSIKNNDISIYLPNEGQAVIEVFDIYGRLVSSTKSSGLIKTIETHSLQSGVYIVNVIYSNQTLFKKFVVD